MHKHGRPLLEQCLAVGKGQQALAPTRLWICCCLHAGKQAVGVSVQS